jgi:hypothetical protein
MATKQVKKQNKAPQEKRELSNVIQFSSIKKTRTGIAVFVGKNVMFINDGLLKYINKKAS